MIQSTGFRVVRAVLLTAFALYFFLPLYSMLDFSIQGKGDSTGSLTFETPRTPWSATRTCARRSSPRCCWPCCTVLLMVVLLVPTMIWVRLRVPEMSRTVEFLCLLPLTVPAAGHRGRHRTTSTPGSTTCSATRPQVLIFVYVILVLPYSYRSIDSALQAIDVTTLAEAARSLGAGWITVITRIVMPNIVSGILSAAFVSIALVLGEFVIASLLHYDTMPVALAAIYK